MEGELEEMLARARAGAAPPGFLLEVATRLARSGAGPGAFELLAPLIAATEARRAAAPGNDPGLAGEVFACARVLGVGLGDPRLQLPDAFWAGVHVTPGGRHVLVECRHSPRLPPVRIFDAGSWVPRGAIERWGRENHMAFPAGDDLLRRFSVSGFPLPGRELEIADIRLPDAKVVGHRLLDLGADTELLGVRADGGCLLLRWSDALTFLDPDSGEPWFVELPDERPRLFDRATFDPTGTRVLVHGFLLPEGTAAYQQPFYSHFWQAQGDACGLFLLEVASGRTLGALAASRPWMEHGGGPLASHGGLRELCGWGPGGDHVAWVERRKSGEFLVVRDGTDLGLVGELDLGTGEDGRVEPWNISRGGTAPRTPVPRWVDGSRIEVAAAGRLRRFRVDPSARRLEEEAPLSGSRIWATGSAALGEDVAVVTPWSLEILRGTDGAILHGPRGHRAPIRELHPFPDRPLLVTVDRIGELRTWDPVTGACPLAVDLGTLEGAPGAPVRPGWEVVPFGQAGAPRVLACAGGSAWVLDGDTGEVLHRIRREEGGNPVWCHFAPSPRGDAILALARDGALDLVDVASGEVRGLVPPGPRRRGCGFARGGDLVVAIGSDSLRTWSARDGRAGPAWEDLGHWGRGCPTWAQDLPGEDAFLAQSEWGYAQRLPFDGGVAEDWLDDPAGTDAVREVRFSPDGTRFATLPVEPGAKPSNRLLLWDRATRRALAYATTPVAPDAGIAWSPCGELLFHAEVAHVRILEVDGPGWEELPRD